MDDSELRKTLEELHQELKEINGIDDGSRQRLEQLMVDIYSVLDREEALSVEHDRWLGEQLVDEIQLYEASHPALTATLQHVLEILSRAGI